MSKARVSTCLIAGCARTTSKMDGGQWICGEHWRIACPPRSPERRAYHRIFRLVRRYGWTPELVNRYWVVWRAIKRRGRRRCAGDIDKREIDRMFGFEE